MFSLTSLSRFGSNWEYEGVWRMSIRRLGTWMQGTRAFMRDKKCGLNTKTTQSNQLRIDISENIITHHHRLASHNDPRSYYDISSFQRMSPLSGGQNLANNNRKTVFSLSNLSRFSSVRAIGGRRYIVLGHEHVVSIYSSGIITDPV